MHVGGAGSVNLKHCCFTVTELLDADLLKDSRSLHKPPTFDGNDTEYQHFRFSFWIHMSFVSAVSYALMDKCVAERNQISLAAVKARVHHIWDAGKSNRRWSETSHHQPESTLFDFSWRNSWIWSILWKLHLSTSCHEPRNTFSASRRVIACSIQLHWCCPTHANTFGHILHEQKSTIIGKSMVNDHYLHSELDSRASQCWLNLHLTDVFEQEKDSQRFKLHPGLMKFWPEVWSNVSKQSQSEERRQWDTDKPRLDAARRLRGIYYIWFGQ